MGPGREGRGGRVGAGASQACQCTAGQSSRDANRRLLKGEWGEKIQDLGYMSLEISEENVLSA